MIVVRNKRFSDSGENKKKAKSALLAGGGAGLIWGSGKLGNKIMDKGGEILETTRNNSANAEAVKKSLLEEAKKRGVTVSNVPRGDNSAYIGNQTVKKLREWFDKKLEKLPKSVREQFKEELERRTGDTGMPVKWNEIGEDIVKLGGGPLSDADVLAHELGHREHTVKGGTGKKMGKLAHGIPSNMIDGVSRSKLGKGAFFLNGLHSGIEKEKNKSEGKKTGIFTKVKSVAIPALGVAPGLIAEAAASRHGYRAMKRLGADPRTLELARKRLRGAFATYVGNSLSPIAYGAGGELVGHGIGKLKYRKDKE